MSLWRKFLTACMLALAFCQCGASTSADAERRIALVIGNADYANEPLANTVNDAHAVGNTLASLGFDVLRYENLDRQRMRLALLDFKQRLGHGGVGLFYFAGHGMQAAGKTLLLPVDTETSSPAQLAATAIDLGSVLRGMSGPRPGKLNLVILDTCLNDPLRGIASIMPRAPDRTLIAYATSPGGFAADGARHGVYTAQLLRALATADGNAEQIFRSAAHAVRQATDGAQQPWISSSLPGDFRFGVASRALPPIASETALVPHSRGILPQNSAEQYELTFWDSIKNSNQASDYEAYLQTYPNGRFAALARARLERLRTAAPQPAAPRTSPPSAAPAPAPKAAPKHPPAAPPVAPSSEKPAAPAGLHDLKDCADCPDLIALPAGTFTMGSNSSDPSERPAHRVSIAKPFAIGKYEVTVGQWDACVQAGGCPHLNNGSDRPKKTPVRDVSWDDAQQYVKWLTKSTGKHYRLPTESEWEYAARAGTTTRFWWGEQMSKGKADCKDCGAPWQQQGPTEVGSFAPNPWGLYDTSGSVWEWVSDCWHNSYKGAPSTDHAWDEANCRMRVIRGGSWREGASYMPSTTRFKYDAGVRYSQNGFRVARDLE